MSYTKKKRVEIYINDHNVFLKILNFFIKIIFDVFKFFRCTNIKNNFLKIKKFIFMYFQAKNILNRHHYHNPNQALTIFMS